jgi:hypothetical protein
MDFKWGDIIIVIVISSTVSFTNNFILSSSVYFLKFEILKMTASVV